MDRRRFLTLSGAGALAGVSSFRPLRTAFAQSLDIYAASTAAHAIASGNAFYSTPGARDWYAIRNTLTGVRDEWLASRRDDQVTQAVSSVSPSQIHSGALDQWAILRHLQMYQPAMQLTDVQAALNFLDTNQGSVPWVLDVLRGNGMAYFLNNAISYAGQIGDSLQSMGMANLTMERLRSENSMGLVAPALRPPIRRDDGGGGGRRYNCEADGAALFFTGIALTTITVMTMGTAPVLVGAAWGAITVWGGLGSAAWGIGHVLAGCGF
jgi:hypothetical protein